MGRKRLKRSLNKTLVLPNTASAEPVEARLSG
jgi:hypothetical protein